MRKKTTIILTILIFLLFSYFLIQRYYFGRSIQKIEKLGGLIGYGFSEVLSVNFSNCEINNSNLKLLLFHKNLESLNLSYTNINDIRILEKFHNLLYLEIVNCNINFEQIINLKNLEVLTVKSSQYSENELIFIKKNNRKLEIKFDN